MSLLDSENVRIIDVQDDKTQNIDTNDINRLRPIENEKIQKRQGDRQNLAETKPKKYNWAFFCASLFIGIGIGAAADLEAGPLFGMGIGFLFFVDPIYQKVMQKIDKW